jgi:hypothetical protein
MERTAAASEWRREAEVVLAGLDLSRLSVRQARRGLEVLRAAAAARTEGAGGGCNAEDFRRGPRALAAGT